MSLLPVFGSVEEAVSQPVWRFSWRAFPHNFWQWSPDVRDLLRECGGHKL